VGFVGAVGRGGRRIGDVKGEVNKKGKLESVGRGAVIFLF